MCDPFAKNNQGPLLGNIYQVIYPSSRLYDHIYISQRYETEILSHITALYLQNYEQFKPPMYLAIEGEAGEGKTSQVLATSVVHGITALYASASQLSGKTEGDSLQRMNRLYDDAVKLRLQGKVTVIVLDDFHMSDANMAENIERTINSTLLTGYLMNLTEKPFSEQIPIILTGNDFSCIYGPLLRSGRANKLAWKLTVEEKNSIKQEIIREYCTLNSHELNAFLSASTRSTIADIAQLKNDYRNLYLKEALKNLDIINKEVLNEIDRNISLHAKCDYRTLCELAKLRGLLND